MDNIWKYYQLNMKEGLQEKSWAESLKEIGTVKHTPELLYTLDKIKEAGIENIMDLNFFKDNIKPMWEDPVNINGGRCILDVPFSQKNNVFDFWKTTVAYCYSGVFSSICGCVFAEKANYRISIWISDARDSDEIIKTWKELLNCGLCTFDFSLHNKSYDHGFARKKHYKNKYN